MRAALVASLRCWGVAMGKGSDKRVLMCVGTGTGAVISPLVIILLT